MKTQAGDKVSSPVATKVIKNVFHITIDTDDDDDEKKNNSQEIIIDTEDNWIAQFLYGGPIGLTINFTLLILATIYFIKSDSNEFHRENINPLWIPKAVQFFAIVLPIEILLNALIVLILFQLSRLSRSTIYYWLLGLTFSAVIFLVMISVRDHLNFMVRLVVMANWARLSMKVTSFLVECNQSEDVYKKSTMMSLLYYLLIPHLIYKHEYPRARSIRWIKLLSHMWWLWTGGFALLTLFHQHQSFFQVDLATVEPEKLAWVLLAMGGVGIISYPLIVWFFIFENFCGFFGEVLRFPYLKLFGPISEVVSGSQVAVSVNIIVSSWLSRYIYVPAVKKFTCRVKAMWITMTISMAVHEIILFYILNFWIILCSPIIFIGWPSGLSLRPKNKLLQFILFSLLAAGGLIYALFYALEFLAVNFSSIPGIDETSRIRIVPIFWEPLHNNLFK